MRILHDSGLVRTTSPIGVDRTAEPVEELDEQRRLADLEQAVHWAKKRPLARLYPQIVPS